MSTKPVVANPDGNIFAILGAVQSALRRAGQKKQMEEFQMRTEKAMQDGETDYNGMLRICMEYVEFQIDEEDEEEEESDWEDEEEDEEESE
jgi:hypothetical protein